uniref:Uncharacterized protein n=1 Tax=Ciona savignyi TaxID=51511 RepID=H2Z5P4_CIOSA
MPDLPTVIPASPLLAGVLPMFVTIGSRSIAMIDISVDPLQYAPRLVIVPHKPTKPSIWSP